MGVAPHRREERHSQDEGRQDEEEGGGKTASQHDLERVVVAHVVRLVVKDGCQLVVGGAVDEAGADGDARPGDTVREGERGGGVDDVIST